MKGRDVAGIFLETAHPGKFKEVVEETLNEEINLPIRLQDFMSRKKQSIKISSLFDEFRSLLPTLIS